MKARMNYYPKFPEAFAKLNEIEALIEKSSLDKHVLHLVKIRVSQINGCLFCIDLHSKEARKDGERELRLHHLTAWHESTLFTDKEKAALKWAEVLTQISMKEVTDELYLATREHFDETELTALTTAIGTINMWNRFGVSFRSTPGTLDKLYGVENLNL